MSLMTTEIVL